MKPPLKDLANLLHRPVESAANSGHPPASTNNKRTIKTLKLDEWE